MSSSICIHKNGKRIESVDDWFCLAPPKEGLRQWKDGRSAKELARAWFPQPGDPRVPSGLISLLNSHPDLIGAEIIEGIPEHKIPLDNFCGETRNADLVLIGKREEIKLSINIEAKADEPFDQTIADKLKAAKKPKSKISDGIDLLFQALFGKSPETNPELLNLRYQLMTGCAGSLIEASKIGAKIAVFAVHVFISDVVDDEKIRANDNDYIRFLKYLAGVDPGSVNDGFLVGPVMVPGGPFVSSDIQLYVGKIKTVLPG